MESYREMQTMFVSHLTGSSILEVLCLIAIIPSQAILLRDLVLVLVKPENVMLCIVIDYLCYIIPPLLACTIMSNHLTALTLIMLMMCGLIVIMLVFTTRTIVRRRRTVLTEFVINYLKEHYTTELRHVTALKAYTLICTCIAILAVDFIVFPRQFAKTETFGVSFMDIGVGAFIISNAIVSPEARNKCQHLTTAENVSNLLSILKSCTAILLLGICRLVAVKWTNYHEHVSEYGVHWNFFFTLVAVKVLSSLITFIFPSKYFMFLATIITVLYEYSLNNRGLLMYIISDGARDNLIDANREGLYSIAGYLSLYLFGIQIGNSLFSKTGNRLRCIVVVFSLLMITILISSVLYWNGFPVSRRLANLGYTNICLLITCLSLLAFMFVDFARTFMESFFSAGIRPAMKLERSAIKKMENSNEHPQHEENSGKKSDKIVPIYSSSFDMLKAVNENGLAFFLVANLLTGLVNFSMQTIRASPTTGFIVISVYTLLITLTFSALSIYKIRVKLS